MIEVVKMLKAIALEPNQLEYFRELQNADVVDAWRRLESDEDIQ